jgi:hypothetical protein
MHILSAITKFMGVSPMGRLLCGAGIIMLTANARHLWGTAKTFQEKHYHEPAFYLR